ncbi:MAG: BACON domain-containing carbohydrate-binding protein [Bacteroidales bacterium]|nr:BACON domain-containing carbohydrate-binding protein [Bacteroidales bacterium]
MKLKYFLSFFALVALLSSCSDDDSMTLLDEIKVSSSYVSIDVNGGSNTITVNAKDAWSFDAEEVPEWLTISPMTGTAGETKVTFSAPAASDGRNTVLHMACADKSQTINVIQGIAVVNEATCAEVIAGPESKTYRVTGTVASIVNTTYGNWYLRDETGEVYIYGTLDAKGNTKNFLSLGLEVGDIVTVEGPKTLYGTTVELVDVTVVKIQKSLVKVEGYDPEDATIPVEGGTVAVNLTCKTNNGVSVEIPEAAKDWLGIVSVAGGAEPVVTFRAGANTGGDRSAVVVFKTTDDNGQEYTAEATIYQKGSIVECSVADFLAAETGDTQYRITGVISSVANPTYGNVYIRDWSGETYVYGIGAKGDFEAAGLKAGDIVTLVGKRGEYKDVAQMTGAVLEDVKHVTAVTIDEFLDKEDNPDVYYMLTGTITEIANPTYGNLYLDDGTNDVYVYGCYPGWGATGDNCKNLLETLGIVVGDELSVIGVKSTYKDTPQLANGIYFSHTKAQ